MHFLLLRSISEDEPSSVGYPTRTVLITSLDSGITDSELRSAFDQYGDIVVRVMFCLLALTSWKY